jgi:hypothetical protein
VKRKEGKGGERWVSEGNRWGGITLIKTAKDRKNDQNREMMMTKSWVVGYFSQFESRYCPESPDMIGCALVSYTNIP